MIRRCLKYAGIVTGMSVIGLVLLMLVYSFDHPSIGRNIAHGLQYVPTEHWSAYGVFGMFRGALLDTPTENTMLRTAALEQGKSALMNAVSMHDYERYWHGYVLVLRPLLRFIPLPAIYVLNMVVFYALFAWMLVLLGKRTGTAYAVMLAVSFVPAFFFLIPLCMQFVSVFLIAFAVSVFILAKERSYETQCVLFVVAGALTSYFDFLTAPLVTLTLPLCVLLAAGLYSRKEQTARSLLRETLVFACLWAFGYFGLWMMKWIIASLLLHRNMIADGMGQMLTRVGAQSRNITRTQAVWMNLETYTSEYLSCLILPALAVNAIIAVPVCIRRPQWMAMVLVELMPLVWFAVLSNHTAIHCFMTYRMLVPSVFIMLVMLKECLSMVSGRAAHD